MRKQLLHFRAFDNRMILGAFDIARNRKALQVEPKSVACEKTLKPDNELRNNLIRVGHDKGLVGLQWQCIQLRLNVACQHRQGFFAVLSSAVWVLPVLSGGGGCRVGVTAIH